MSEKRSAAAAQVIDLVDSEDSSGQGELKELPPLPFHAKDDLDIKKDSAAFSRKLIWVPGAFKGERQEDREKAEVFRTLAADVNNITKNLLSASEEEMGNVLQKIEENYRVMNSIPLKHFGKSRLPGDPADVQFHINERGGTDKGLPYDKYEALHRFDDNYRFISRELGRRVQAKKRTKVEVSEIV